MPFKTGFTFKEGVTSGNASSVISLLQQVNNVNKDSVETEREKFENRIVLVTGKEIAGGFGVVVEELETTARSKGKQVKANKAVTVYPKSNIANAIEDAIAEGRILYIDKKRSQTLHSGVKGSNYPTAISEADFTNNIRRFRENVKWKNSGNKLLSRKRNKTRFLNGKSKAFGDQNYKNNCILPKS